VTYLPVSLKQVMTYFGNTPDELPERVASIRFDAPAQSDFSSIIRITWYSVPFRAR